jgi:hypothetical protein
VTSLVELVSGAEALLFDFDGPVCRVFAGYTADTVAEDLRRSLSVRGITFPADVAASADIGSMRDLVNALEAAA